MLNAFSVVDAEGQGQSKDKSLGAGYDAAGSGDSSLVPLSLWAADRFFFGVLTVGESHLFVCTPHVF